MLFWDYVRKCCRLAGVQVGLLDDYELNILLVLWEHQTPVEEAIASVFGPMPADME